MDADKQLVRRLLKIAGTTYAAEAGVRLADKPKPLFQLLVLAMLASKPIDAAIAMRAGRELFKEGLRTPKTVLAADRQTMITVFGRAHYVRYDESSATRLTHIAERVRDEYSGDLRELARRGDHDVRAAARLLTKFNGIGPTGAEIFLREAQDVWTWARPYFDKCATGSAQKLGLPGDPKELGSLAPGENARLAAALVRVSLHDDLHRQVSG
ncbi:endonuclease [Mycobacterium heckeshornense]|uniref:Endonuclease n=1 Tax=Mycobacterium heckeshornense TaxID=110505 RepID=A0A2G8BD62_9MYCO|nr:endonuclease [Mycobacterium heckeshornense]KMV23025.1 endonuclease [Mycobacterium heckeshornense]MCV7036093.1 endonuclease [Mycobacterium heckeshornense]PIJ35701.1 endonuclease [Mycobacterium heckeshornense]BCO35850.1 endonuclease [Mycobacterium heckeshornense]